MPLQGATRAQGPLFDVERENRGLITNPLDVSKRLFGSGILAESWFGDPAWSGRPADGQPIDGVRDTVGPDAVATNATFRPLMVDNWRNGMPAALFDGTDDGLFHDLTDVPQAYYLMAVGQNSHTGTNTKNVMGLGATDSRGMGIRGNTGTPNGNYWSMNASTVIVSDTVSGQNGVAVNHDTNPHVWIGYFGGAVSRLFVDSREVLQGNPGSSAIATFGIGVSESAGGARFGSWAGHIAYAMGVVDGADVLGKLFKLSEVFRRLYSF